MTCGTAERTMPTSRENALFHPERNLRSCSKRCVRSPVHACHLTAFSFVPMKSAGWSVCLSPLKNTAIPHLARYSSQIVLAADFVLFVRNVISLFSPLTSPIARTRRNVCGHLSAVFAAVRGDVAETPDRLPGDLLGNLGGSRPGGIIYKRRRRYTMSTNCTPPS